MIRKNILFTALIIVFFLAVSCSGEPNIEFGEMEFDFGDVKQEEEHEHIFIFKNTGDSTLIIEKVKAG